MPLVATSTTMTRFLRLVDDVKTGNAMHLESLG
jgi:hypothetical protein